MGKTTLLILCLLSFTTGSKAQQPGSPDERERLLIEGELNRYTAMFHGSDQQSSGAERIDVTYYRLNLTITTSPEYLADS